MKKEEGKFGGFIKPLSEVIKKSGKDVEDLSVEDNKEKTKEKKSHEDFILKLRENDMKEYINNLVRTAEWLLRDLKDYQERLQREEWKDSYAKKEDFVRWAMNIAQQVNWHFDNGADVVSKYMVAKVNLEFSKKQA